MHKTKHKLSNDFSHIPLIDPLFQVNVSFSLTQVPGVETLFEPEFSCDITSAELAPGGSRQATVTYSPAVADTVSVVYLSLKYGGALTESQLKLTGKCIGKKPSALSSQNYKHVLCTICSTYIPYMNILKQFTTKS